MSELESALKPSARLAEDADSDLELRESVAAELSASVDAVENGDSTRDLEDVARLGWAGLEDAFPPP